MKSTQLTQESPVDNRLFLRLIKIMLVAVLVVTVIFGGYYYWDRYVHVGDQSPTELGISHLLRIVQENPNDPDARLSLAQTYIEAGNYSEAIRHAQKVLKAYPDNAGALMLMGVAFSKMGQAKDAVNYLEQFTAIRRKSEDPNMDKVLEAGLYFLGQNYLIVAQPDKAIAVLKEALDIDSTDADVLVLLGDAYNQTGQYQQAVESYESTVRFVPDYVEAYQGLVVSYQALNMVPNVTYAKGMEAYSNKDFQKARDLLTQSSAELANFAPVYLGLALTYEQLGDPQFAIVYARKTMELDPSNFAASNLLSRLSVENK